MFNICIIYYLTIYSALSLSRYIERYTYKCGNVNKMCFQNMCLREEQWSEHALSDVTTKSQSSPAIMQTTGNLV